MNWKFKLRQNIFYSYTLNYGNYFLSKKFKTINLSCPLLLT